MAETISTDNQNFLQEMTLQLKEEQLILVKRLIQRGDVKIYRESFTEEKSFKVPIECEELVIEKKIPASETSAQDEMLTEVIRIRLSEEQVEFKKNRVTLEDISIYKQQIEEIKHIEKTLKKEEPNIKIFGSPTVNISNL